MMCTLNFKPFVLFVRLRCFKLLDRLVLSVWEANFVLKFVIFRPKMFLTRGRQPQR